MSAAIEMAPGVFRIPTMGDYINTIAFVRRRRFGDVG